MTQRTSAAEEAFERALEVAVSDGLLGKDELTILVGLARAAGSAASDEEAAEYVRTRARAMGATEDRSCRSPAASSNESRGGTPAEPPPLPVFTYSDGSTQVSGLTGEAVATRVRAAPDGVHLVWRHGMVSWAHPRDVQEIAALLK